MNKELLNALSRMVDLGKFTEDEALKFFIESAIEDLAPLIDLLHTVACTKEHACDPTHLARRREGVCYYELEAQVHKTWDFPDHKEWVEVFYNIAREAGYDKVRDIITAIGAINANAQLVGAKSPTAVNIVRGLIDAAFESPSEHRQLKCPSDEPV